MRERRRRLSAQERFHRRVVGAQLVSHEVERSEERTFFEFDESGGGRGHGSLELRELAVGVLGQAFGFGQLSLGRGAHERTGEVVQLRIGEGQCALPRRERLALDQDRGNFRPRVADLLRQRRVFGDGLTQRLLFGPLLGHEPGVGERELLIAANLDAVLEALERHGQQLAAFRARARVFVPQPPAIRPVHQGLRQRHVAGVFELGHGQQPVGATRVTRHEDRLARFRTLGAPTEGVGRHRGLAVLVRTQERHVEVVPGEIEVVGVATERGDVHLRGEDHAQVFEALVAKEQVLAPVVQVHEFAAGAVHVVSDAGLFERVRHRVERRVKLLGRHALGRFAHLGRDVFGRLELLRLGVGANHFLGQGLGHEGLLQIVHLLHRRQRAQAVVGAVVVGHDEAVVRHERPRAAGQLNRGETRPLQPRRVGHEAIGGRHFLRRQRVERPHAFVGRNRHRRQPNNHDNREGSFHGRLMTSDSADVQAH